MRPGEKYSQERRTLPTGVHFIGMMLELTLVVLAAGIGSRYGGLKQIDPVGPSGEIIIDYSIYDALQAGFGKVVFGVSETIEEVFRERVGRTIEQQCETAYVLQRLEDLPAGFQVPPERQKPWGTAHATRCCIDEVNTPFAVINADDFYGRAAYRALAQYLQQAKDREDAYDYCMAGYLLEDTLTEHGHVARGVCSVSSQGYLVEIRERLRVERVGDAVKYTEDGQSWVEIPKGSTVSMNMWGFTLSLLPELQARFAKFLRDNRDRILEAEFLLPEVVGAMVRETQATVKVLPANERWFGVTYQEDRPRVEASIRNLVSQGVYPVNLWGGTG